jgi:GT2 family glycosyltransferase
MIAGAVTVGFLHPGKYSACFADSLTQLLFRDASSSSPRIVSHSFGQLGKNTPPAGIVDGRNHLARVMCDDSEAEWLFMVDSDMAFDADIVDRLIAAADPVDRPVVGALAFAHKTDGQASLGGVIYCAVPTIYHWFEDDADAGFVPMFDYPRDALVPAAATGGACLLIHRSVLVAMRERFGDLWFDLVDHPKHRTKLSEDLSFCLRLAAIDVPLFIHTGIRTGHDKGSQFLDEAFYDAQRAARAAI